MTALDAVRRALLGDELNREFDLGARSQANLTAIKLYDLAEQWDRTAGTQPPGPARAALETCASNLRKLIEAGL